MLLTYFTAERRETWNPGPRPGTGRARHPAKAAGRRLPQRQEAGPAEGTGPTGSTGKLSGAGPGSPGAAGRGAASPAGQRGRPRHPSRDAAGGAGDPPPPPAAQNNNGHGCPPRSAAGLHRAAPLFGVPTRAAAAPRHQPQPQPARSPPRAAAAAAEEGPCWSDHWWRPLLPRPPSHLRGGARDAATHPPGRPAQPAAVTCRLLRPRRRDSGTRRRHARDGGEEAGANAPL